jgi:hypothetical protein
MENSPREIEMNTRAADRARKLAVVTHSDMCTQNPDKTASSRKPVEMTKYKTKQKGKSIIHQDKHKK